MIQSSICYQIKRIFIEHKEITIKNNSDFDRLCRVAINHELFKIIYLTLRAEEVIKYTGGVIRHIEVSRIEIEEGE